ncbi:hypothetical protein ACCO45_007104 [Purpureocillium lilacinum]|uniref:Uncharacterized protein n=1 Tax=Purpureocillium lilacinum TaxID=33203 RepID=A0ACC4DRE7_PURLI
MRSLRRPASATPRVSSACSCRSLARPRRTEDDSASVPRGGRREGEPVSTRMPRDEAPARRAERVIACFEPVRAAAADNLFHPKSPPFVSKSFSSRGGHGEWRIASDVSMYAPEPLSNAICVCVCARWLVARGVLVHRADSGSEESNIEPTPSQTSSSPPADASHGTRLRPWKGIPERTTSALTGRTPVHASRAGQGRAEQGKGRQGIEELAGVAAEAVPGRISVDVPRASPITVNQTRVEALGDRGAPLLRQPGSCIHRPHTRHANQPVVTQKLANAFTIPTQKASQRVGAHEPSANADVVIAQPSTYVRTTPAGGGWTPTPRSSQAPSQKSPRNVSKIGPVGAIALVVASLMPPAPAAPSVRTFVVRKPPTLRALPNGTRGRAPGMKLDQRPTPAKRGGRMS